MPAELGELALDPLLFRKNRVDSAIFAQLLVSAAFYHAALFEHDDLITVGGGGHAVRDQDQAAPFALAIDGIQDGALRTGVHRAQWIVEHQHLGLRGKGGGQRDALLLTARELHATLTHHGVEAVRQIQHLLFDAGLARGLFDFEDRLVRVRFVQREGDVARDRGREQKRILLRVTDAFSHHRQW